MLKILVVEDEATLRKALQDYLEAEGFFVIPAIDGEEGSRLAITEKPDIILLDIVLPKKDGYEVLSDIKNDEATKKIPVILLTNLERPEDIEKAIEKGASTYLVKSEYKLEEIAAKVKETLKM